MEHNVRVLPPEILAECLPELLEDTQTVPLIISGSSMSSSIWCGGHSAAFSSASAPFWAVKTS